MAVRVLREQKLHIQYLQRELRAEESPMTAEVPRLSGQPSESERGEQGKKWPGNHRAGCQMYHRGGYCNCDLGRAAPSPAQPTEEGGSAACRELVWLENYEAYCALEPGHDMPHRARTGGGGVIEWDDEAAIASPAAPSPPASARERCLETVADAMTVAVGYVEAMREHPPDAAVIVNLRGLLENARTVLRSALDTERGKK